MKPWLWIPAKWAHDLSPYFLDIYSQFSNSGTPAWNPLHWNGLVFKNRLGLAGGVDKNGDSLKSWQRLGCGFIELGTVTPEPQKPNPGLIIDRSLADGALWNKMGFPSHGADDVYYNLASFKRESSLPILVNIGKNRTTSNEDAHLDYVRLIHRFHTLADAFVVNISSPNTNGLRDLAQPEALSRFLNPVMEAQTQLQSNKPILIKLSPDLENDDLNRVIDTCSKFDVKGFVLTNTTLERNTQKSFPVEGGVSGAPLAKRSKQALQNVIKHLGAEKSKKLVISVGGVMTAEDVFERIELGADLVEVYSALILSGPQFFRKVAQTSHDQQQGSAKKPGF